MGLNARRWMRRILPTPLRLHIVVVRRAWRDRRAGTVFAARSSRDEEFPQVVSCYQRAFIDYPGQERLAQAKRKNQALLAAKLDGVVISPGETFSVWRLAPRPTTAGGYAPAAALKNRALTTEVGGAICLLSTVLYNVALLGGMRIVERHAHSVDSYGDRRYFELGRDAAIEFGYLDLRFANPHAFAVQLRVKVTEEAVLGSLHAAERPCLRVRLAVTAPEVIPAPTQVVRDPYLPPGTQRVVADGMAGLRVRTTRVTCFADSRYVEEDLGVTVHNAVPWVIAVSTA